jgi:hypothetical protein
MTMTRQLTATPREFQEIHGQFERWRRMRRPGTPIPPPLWAAAVVVARRHGVYRTARALHLESHKLKTLTETPARAQSVPASPSFVELLAPPSSGSTYLLEVDGPHGGRLRLQVTGQGLPDVVALSRVVWGDSA